jgi:hypothetical protein
VTPPPSSWRDWIVVAIAGAAVSLPYLDKPFHIDDVLYLRVADQILRTPLDPYHGIVLWDAKDGQPASLFLTDHNPPLWKYCQAAVLDLFAPTDRRGESERLLHLLQSYAVILGGLGVYQLGRRLTPYPVWATLFVLTAPFFLPGQNIMLEAPVLCFSVWAIEFQFRAWESRRWLFWSLVAGIVVAAAILTKYTAGLLLPILALESLRRRQPRSLVFLIPPALALIGWGAWCFLTHGRPHLGAHGLAFDVGQWHYKALNVVRLIGSMQTLGVALVLGWLLHRGESWQRKVVIAGLLGVAAMALGWLDVIQARYHSGLENADITPLQRAHFVLFTAHGVLTLGIAFLIWTKSAGTDSNDSFLLLWVAAVLVFNICCTPFNAVRHLLLFFVPLVWMAGRWLERWLASGLRWPALAVSAVIGVGLAAADFQFAESARDVARNEVRGLVSDRASLGRTVWFSGNWGFVHYAQRAGALPWIKNPEELGMPSIQVGDYIVQPMIMSWTNLDNALPKGMKRQWVKHWQPMAATDGTPTRTLGQLLRTISPGVNYYSIRANALPWEVLVTPVDPIDRGTGALFAVPTLGDYRIDTIVRDPS